MPLVSSRTLPRFFMGCEYLVLTCGGYRHSDVFARPFGFHYREGKHADYHYLICGVQGDFTRSLVENPPTRIWTRELKVRKRGFLQERKPTDALYRAVRRRF